MKLPLILIIDDQFGRSFSDRRNLCLNYGLVDVTGDDENPEKIENPISHAVFSSAQKKSNGVIENDPQIALGAIKSRWNPDKGLLWSLVLLDIRFVSGDIDVHGDPDGCEADSRFGITLLDKIVKKFSDIPVIMLSSRERGEVIDECRSKGALDFIQRVGFSTDTVSPKKVLEQKLYEHGLLQDTRNLPSDGKRIVGRSLALKIALRSARRAATGSGNILLLGETGTGKELFAQYIHDVSPSSTGAFKVFHPFGIAETLQEDELFGHVKGAFTGADRNKQGLFESADKGTLFIDEVGDIAESIQVKLLRPLENKKVKRQGGTKELDIDIQVVLATNKNLDEYSNQGKFKADLLNRINAYTIKLPNLNERKVDIIHIAEYLLEGLCRVNNARWPKKFLPETIELLENFDWKDNIRGLRNSLERAVKNSPDLEQIIPSDLEIIYPSLVYGSEQPQTSVTPILNKTEDEFNVFLNSIEKFEFPNDYSILKGSLPELQRVFTIIYAKYLTAAIECTKKLTPDGPQAGEINITGAVSCMVGEQLKTPKAADIVKKILQQEKTVLDEILKEYPALKVVYTEALKKRPKRPTKKTISND